jgi:hypothetical protein
MEKVEGAEMLWVMASSTVNGLGIVGPALIVFLGWLEPTVEIKMRDERWVKSWLDYGQEIGGN